MGIWWRTAFHDDTLTLKLRDGLSHWIAACCRFGSIAGPAGRAENLTVGSYIADMTALLHSDIPGFPRRRSKSATSMTSATGRSSSPPTASAPSTGCCRRPSPARAGCSPSSRSSGSATSAAQHMLGTDFADVGQPFAARADQRPRVSRTAGVRGRDFSRAGVWEVCGRGQDAFARCSDISAIRYSSRKRRSCVRNSAC